MPSTNPVTGTTISASENATFRNDVATEFTDSLSRSAKGAMLAILQLHDGASATVPDLTFSGDIDTGLGHSGANILNIIAGGTSICAINASGFGAFTSTALISTTVAGSSLSQTTADTALIITGNRSAASTGNADVRVASTATRSAGNILDVVNNATMKLAVDFSGQVKWPSWQASTATTPAPSAITAITPDTNFTAGSGLGFWKDAFNVVHLRGLITNTAAGAKGNMVSGANVLPAGFRPTSNRGFPALENVSNTTTHNIVVATTGAIQIFPNCTTGEAYFLDGISYVAEA